MKHIITILSSFLIFTSCNQKSFDSKEDLLSYIKVAENGYYQTKIISGVKYELLYKPTDLLVYQEINTKSTSGQIDSLRRDYKKYVYFNLSMSKDNQELLSAVPTNRNEFGAMVSQLSFGLSEKIHLYTNHNDTISLSDYSYPRLYGTTRTTSIFLAYPRGAEMREAEFVTLSIEDFGLNSGEVKFKINRDRIKNEPKLNI